MDIGIFPPQHVSAAPAPSSYRSAVHVEIGRRDDKYKNINRLDSVNVYAGVNLNYESEFSADLYQLGWWRAGWGQLLPQTRGYMSF